MTASPTRWPLHPRPGPLESLTSWLERLAVLCGMTTKDLLGPHNLPIGDFPIPHDLDADPPPVMLSELAKRVIRPFRTR